ncbi:MAG: hypothetical protein JXJ17_06680 [Anaerolineae bacterium]|nr:hypothetical protein [Anaerolineae bacterium]
MQTIKALLTDRRLQLRTLGALMLIVGLAFTVIGPVEVYCFTLFAEGGRFHYPGYGFGSVMFANIAIQIAGYYTIAALGLILGMGHLRLRRWIRPVMITFLWAWLIVGLPLVLIALLIFIQSKDPTLLRFLILLPFAALIYPVLPILLIRFYNRGDVVEALGEGGPFADRLESTPLTVRILVVTLAFSILALHGRLLFRGIFPAFGVILVDLPGYTATAAAILVLLILTWGVSNRYRWAWWGSLTAFLALTLSSAITLPRYTYPRLLDLIALPPLEAEALAHVPLQNPLMTLITMIPLLAVIAVILAARRFFVKE